MNGDTRKATTTADGDTGLWFVPTGEILPAKKWSFSVYRVNFDYEEGFTDVSNWPVTFGVGLGDRAELFGAFHVVRRIDRDVRPIFTSNAEAGGMVNEYPFVRQGWSGNQLGDLWIGAKINLIAPWRNQNAGPAFALRGMVKIPTAKDDDDNDEPGVGTGKMDFAFDAILSKEFNERVELSGFAGFIVRGDPDGVDLTNGIRWGFGAGFPTRANLRLTAELHGEKYLDDEITQLADPDRARGRVDCAAADQPRFADQRVAGPDVDAGQLVPRRRAELPLGARRPQRVRVLRGRDGRFARLPVPPRLSPGRADLRPTAAATTAAATSSRRPSTTCR